MTRGSIAVLVAGAILAACVLGPQDPTPAPTVQLAAAAAGWDPATLMDVDDDHVVAVRIQQGEMTQLGVFTRADGGWVYDAGFGTTRFADASGARVILSGAPTTDWQIHAYFGTLADGAVTFEMDRIGFLTVLGPDRTFFSLLPSMHEVPTAEILEATWRMRDADGNVVLEGQGDCCNVEAGKALTAAPMRT